MLKFAIPAVASLALIAVAAQSRATDAETQPIQGQMGWHLSHEPGLAKLAYGVENSDQLAIMLTCQPGEALASVYGDVAPATPRLVKAAHTETLIDPLNGGLVEDVRISTNDTTLQTLRRDGTLAVDGEVGRFELTASRDERRLISDFFAYCGTAKA